MKIKVLIWEHFLDPIIRRIESRIEHIKRLRPITHDGSCWENKAVIGESVVFHSEAELSNFGEKENIDIGKNCHIRGEILVFESGRFKIGSFSYIGPGTHIWCRQKITIGSNVLISYLVDIHDTNAHSLDWEARRDESTELFQTGRAVRSAGVVDAPIVIEDNVWIGFKSTILKGVTIGRGAVVAAGSVVTKDVPPFTLVAGHPATIVRELRSD